MPFVLIVNAGLPMDDARGLAAWLKVRPGEINFGSSGDGSTGHLAGELFRRRAGVSAVHISYSSGVNALNGLATRQVSFMFAALPLTLTYSPSEYFRPLAVTSSLRLGLEPATMSLEQFATRIHTELERWAPLLRRSRLPLTAER